MARNSPLRAQDPGPEPTGQAVSPGFRDLSAVMCGQIDLAESLSLDAAREVMDRTDEVLRTLARLRAQVAELRGDLALAAGGQARPAPDRRAIARDAHLDASLAEIERLVTDYLGAGQVQDISRQVLGGLRDMAQGLASLGVAPEAAEAAARLHGEAAARFVMREQRLAYARALGLSPPDEAPSLELF